MRQPKKIRNVGLLAHIDHGKTTLADHLLARGGVIARNFAGSALYLDYVEEEQRRGITIKTSAISLPLKVNEDVFLLNLVDTPGHVDFSGKTSRALRLIDGCIIVIDAVEGIMAQTRAVIRLALEEWTRPLVFINKLDRLFKLSYSLEQIQERLEDIITGFNRLVSLFGTKKQEQWKIVPSRGTVLFGSALEGWGFSLPQLKTKNMKFEDIMNLYESNQRALLQTFSLQTLLPSVLFEKLPSPRVAQQYRVPRLWMNGAPPKSIVQCKRGLTSVYISKTTSVVGRVFVTGRVFSGKLKKGKVIQARTHEKKRIEGVSILLGDRREVVNEIHAGNIFGAFLDTQSGETFVKKATTGYFREPFYTPVPVIYEAVEPFESHRFDELLKKLKKKTVEDPNLTVRVSEESGRILLGGVGELHLELALKDIQEEMELYISKPKVAYRELLVQGATIRKKGLLIRIEAIDSFSKGPLVKREAIGNQVTVKGFSKEEATQLRKSVKNSLKSGPLAGAPIIGARVRVEKKKDRRLSINECLNVFYDTLASTNTTIYEPVYHLNALTDTSNLGLIQEEMNRREGKIENVKASGGKLIQIKGNVPVRRSIGLANDIRSVTSGEVDLQLKFQGYREAKQKERIIDEISSI